MDVRRVEEELDSDFLSDAQSRTGPVESGDSCKSKIPWIPVGIVIAIHNRMRDMGMKYKAQKVCHEEMVKEGGGAYEDKRVVGIIVYTKSKEEHELHLKMNLELLKKDKCYVKPNKVKAKRRVMVIAYTTRQLEIHVKNDMTHVMDLEGLNMRQRRWMELFSDYGYETKYHMGKANEVDTSKAEDASREMLRGLDRLVERKEDGGLYF
nr:hypothetical protein [Tanacetum cinerariifolium]